jgi:hypothetical protein
LNIINEVPGSGGLFRFNLNNATCGNNNSATGSYTGTNLLNTDWHNLRWVGDVSCTSATNVRCSAVYLDGVLLSGVTLNDVGGNWSGTKTVAFNVHPFYLNAWDNSGISPLSGGHFEVAQFALDLPGSSPMVASSNTPVNPIGNFVTAGGAPMDPGVGCANFFGHTATYCFTNPAASFLTNTGSGANATATGQVTNTFTNQAYAAATAPGETPDRPWVRWRYDTPISCAEATQTCTDASNAGNRIVQGDLLCAVIDAPLGGGSHNNAFAMSGWTTIVATVVSSSLNHAVFCKTAGVGDVTAPGSTWSPPTYTWTTSGTGFSGPLMTIIDFGKYGAGGTTPTVIASGNSSPAAGSLPCPTVSAPSGLSLWTCIHSTYSWGFTGNSYGPPTTSSLQAKLPTGGSGATPMIEFEKIGVSGNVVRTAQESGSALNPSVASVLILN